jgi:hypothetical protein
MVPWDFSRTLASSNSAAPAGAGTLLELIISERAKKEERKARRLARDRNGHTPSPSSSRQAAKRLFLAEFEVCGDLRLASELADCTPADVRAWRQDPMFDRDFTLTAVSHMRALKRMVGEIAETVRGPHAQEAERLLASESSYMDAEGRLDVYGWCRDLRRFAAKLGYDLASWEPSFDTASA